MELSKNAWHDMNVDPPKHPGRYDITILETQTLLGVEHRLYRTAKAEMYFDGYGRAFKIAFLPHEWFESKSVDVNLEDQSANMPIKISKIIAWKEMDKPYLGEHEVV